ncbi:hypothetical protein B0H17DRAFT_1143584 [Mycena rosella]|uniref:Uncharacterized protein n=1 Tax=Mycena rosella TaxID=1033263 RepID=A0AAD7CVD2_MYCRO|nr:hypothetical protein B0H17DRAFT_1143584 [Mycena rosella]
MYLFSFGEYKVLGAGKKKRPLGSSSPPGSASSATGFQNTAYGGDGGIRACGVQEVGVGGRACGNSDTDKEVICRREWDTWGACCGNWAVVKGASRHLQCVRIVKTIHEPMRRAKASERDAGDQRVQPGLSSFHQIFPSLERYKRRPKASGAIGRA